MNHPRRDPRGLLTNDPTLGTEEPLTKGDALDILEGVVSSDSQASRAVVLEDINTRNATETNYAFESCKPAYEAQVEAATLASDLGRLGSVKHGKRPESRLDLPRDRENACRK